MSQTDYDRQKRLWGEEGQSLIENSKIVICGSGNIAKETLKNAAILGIRNIYLISDSESYGFDNFLDQKIKNGYFATEISDIVTKTLNHSANIQGIESKTQEAILNELGRIDAIIDTTNDPLSQKINYSYSLDKGISYFSGASDDYRGQITQYIPTHEHDMRYFEKIIHEFKDARQGVAISNLIGANLIEQFRNDLFYKNRELFKKVIISRRDGSLKTHTGEYTTYYNLLLKRDKRLKNDFKYSLFYEDPDQFNLLKNVNKDQLNKILKSKKALILGCGSIGNYASNILAELKLANIDVVDIDRFDKTNLNRQPLGYESVDLLKSRVISERINKITNKKTSEGIVGIVGEKYIPELIKKSRLSENSIQLVNSNWVRNRGIKYDVIFGCFDNREARLAANKIAVENGIMYIDGGSGGGDDGIIQTQSRTDIYIPGITNCLACKSADNTERNRLRNLEKDELRKKRIRENYEAYTNVVSIGDVRSCNQEWIDGSVNMSNQIAGSMMILSYLGSIIAPEKIPHSMEWRSYEDIIQETHNFEVTCKCGDKN